MATSVNSVLNMGAGALFANQAAIQTTGNNIANVNTVGYSRQKVRFEENPALNFVPGQIGQGARAAEVYRMFNSFVERNYLQQASMESRWTEQTELLGTVESLFNESTNTGIGNSLSSFFSAWQDLTGDGSSTAFRSALLATAETLTSFVKESDGAMQNLQNQMDGLIGTNVAEANQLIKEIAELNRQIGIQHEKGVNNANTLMDQRDLKVRQLGEIVDIDVIDRGGANYKVSTKAGMSLVEDSTWYSFELHGPRAETNLVTGSGFDGEIKFSGSDEYEYTIEVVDQVADGAGGLMAATPPGAGTVDGSGAADPAAGTAMFRVSLDGGRTWLKDDAGNDLLFPARTEEFATEVKDINVSFEGAGGSKLSAGDEFTIVPKSGVYWNSPTTGLINVTPQTFPDGTENNRRLTGGVLTSDFIFRDTQLGEYRESMDAFAKALIWEVNRVHTQGVGLTKNTYMLGDYKADRTDVPIGNKLSGLDFGDRVQQGNFTFGVYDSVTGEAIKGINGLAVGCEVNIDPETDSLDDIAAKINSGDAAAYVQASVVDGRLQISSRDPEKYSFAFADDTSGALAALGINNFFRGSGCSDFAVTERIVGDLNMINAAKVNGAAEGNEGDQDTAREMGNLMNKLVSIGSGSQKKTSQTLLDYYGSIVTKVGADTRSAKYQKGFYGALAQDLRDTQDSNAGVNLDEEMTNLVRFQNSYKAAAKLITTADQMLQTILGLKQ